MATLPKVFRSLDAPGVRKVPEIITRHAPARGDRDSFQLRALPLQDVIFYCKKIDNSRLVREADPKSRGACWSAIAGAALIVAMLTGAMAPAVKIKLAGYRLEALRSEERRLVDERKALELEEAELLNPARLERLARNQNLVTPSSEQVVHLDSKADGTVAMVK
jgi:cell division protein FtsL